MPTAGEPPQAVIELHTVQRLSQHRVLHTHPVQPTVRGAQDLARITHCECDFLTNILCPCKADCVQL